jgi:tagaturonate epimerase
MSSLPEPTPLGLKKSFGYGDRLGLATPGHLAAHHKFDFAPIFAQQSIREMTRTARTPEEVMQAAQNTLVRANFADAWGADADHIKTLEDVRRTSAAGFCFFTIDPSEYVNNRADSLTGRELSEAADRLHGASVFADQGWRERYEGKRFEISDTVALTFERETLERAAVKYGRAIAHTEAMARGIAEIRGEAAFEIEVSVDETDSPTSPLEHLFFALELRRRNVQVVSLAPRFIGDFEKGIDYRGNVAEFEKSLHVHVAIARAYGPYKISIHSGSDKFSIYPAIGRVCGELLHVKTAGTSYLEALRCVLRTRPGAFDAIVRYSAERFSEDRASYHISTTEEEVRALFRATSTEDREQTFLEGRPGRQLLHVTFGSVLTQGKAPDGRPFKEMILETLQTEADLHAELIEKHFTRHLEELTRG